MLKLFQVNRDFPFRPKSKRNQTTNHTKKLRPTQNSEKIESKTLISDDMVSSSDGKSAQPKSKTTAGISTFFDIESQPNLVVAETALGLNQKGHHLYFLLIFHLYLQ